MIIQEQVLPEGKDHYTHRHWVFRQDGRWDLELAEKNDLPLGEDLVILELMDLLDRLEGVLHKTPGRYEIPAPTGPLNQSVFYNVLHRKSSRVFTLAAAGLVMAGLFLTIFISTMQYGRMLKTVYTLNRSILHSSESSSESIAALTGELSRISTELDGLKSEVFQEKEAFLFNRKQTAMNLRWLASRFPRSSSSRAKAYGYLADRIDEAATYGEVVFQLSRLPENNAQAETLMATDRDNRFSMNHYEPVFSGMILPVHTGTETDQSTLFMISSGYIERRLSPLGYGGVKPHHAVDLINLDNIIRISEKNNIVRDDTIPGLIRASSGGTVLDRGFDWVYGWHTEVRHEVTDSVREQYPDALFWSTFYAHMAEPPAVEEDVTVVQGETLGLIGNSGRSTGPHLHFEVRIYRPGGEEESPYGTFDKINPYRATSRQELGG